MTRPPYFRACQIVLTLVVVFVATAPRLSTAAQEMTKTFVMHPAPRPVVAISYLDEQGQTRTLGDFKGRVVVLNIWATWCVPCRREMPALDRLQATLGSSDFEVVPLSIDHGGLDIVNKFYAETGVSHLAKYIDSSGQVLRSLGTLGLPTTLIIDRAGNEVGRVMGAAEWDAPEVVELLKSLIATPNNLILRTTDNKPTGAAGDDAAGLFSRSVRWLKAMIK